MRSLFLLLLLANLLCFAAQFDIVRGLWGEAPRGDRPPQINAERLRLIRDTSRSSGPASAPAADVPVSRSGG